MLMRPMLICAASDTGYTGNFEDEGQTVARVLAIGQCRLAHPE
jgi:hypothetical protein